MPEIAHILIILAAIMVCCFCPPLIIVILPLVLWLLKSTDE